MVFKLAFLKNPTLPRFFLFLVFFLIATVIPQKLNPIGELAKSVGPWTNEAKAETGTHQVVAETKKLITQGNLKP